MILINHLKSSLEPLSDDDDSDEEEEEAKPQTSGKINENDPKLRAKYPFIWKPLEEWKPTERRWLWVKKECMPDDLRKLLYPKENQDKESDKSSAGAGPAGPTVAKDKDLMETVINTQQWLSDDYSLISNVKDNLDALK